MELSAEANPDRGVQRKVKKRKKKITIDLHDL